MLEGFWRRLRDRSCCAGHAAIRAKTDVFDRVKHGYATSEGGVKIHYATLGKGPLVVMIHGFPDFWYSWRHQMDALSEQFQVVAIDQRGYNLSDKPKGVENYDMRLLVGDVAAVIKHLGARQGHDRRPRLGRHGGVAVRDEPAADDREPGHPEPAASERPAARAQVESRADQEQRIRAQLPARIAERSDGVLRPADDAGDAVGMGHRSGGAQALRRGVRALGLRGDAELLQAQLSGDERRRGAGGAAEFPKVKAPVLMFHGLDDTALHSDGLAGTWNWVEKDLTLVTIPGAGHFVQQDAAELVSSTMRSWLEARNR